MKTPSWRAKNPSRTRPPEISQITGDKPSGVNGADAVGAIQPHWPERRMPNTTAPRPAADSTAPVMSSLPLRPATVGIKRKNNMSASTTRVSAAKTRRQE